MGNDLLETGYLLGVLGVLVGSVAPVAVVGLTRGILGRKEYTARFIAAFLLLTVAMTALYEFQALWSLLPMLVLHLLIVRWTAMRLNDLRSDRWYALLWYIAPAGFVLAILLTEMRHRKEVILF